MGLALGLGLATVRQAPAAAGYPAWLPQAPGGDYAVAFADFANGHYWGDGAEKTLADLVSDPAVIVAGGMDFRLASSPTAKPLGVNGLYDAMMNEAGYVQVVTVLVASEVFDNTNALSTTTNIKGNWNASDYGTLVKLTDDNHIIMGAYIAEGGVSVESLGQAVVSGSNKLAFMQDLSKAYLSLNGGTLQSSTPLVTTGLPTLAFYQIGWDAHGDTYANLIIASIAVYAPQPASDLPALST